jgi:hypothetical protein
MGFWGFGVLLLQGDPVAARGFSFAAFKVTGQTCVVAKDNLDGTTKIELNDEKILNDAAFHFKNEGEIQTDAFIVPGSILQESREHGNNSPNSQLPKQFSSLDISRGKTATGHDQRQKLEMNMSNGKNPSVMPARDTTKGKLSIGHVQGI